MPRDEMLSRMSSQELTDWIAYLKIKADEAEERRVHRGR